MSTLTVRIPDKLLRRLDALARRRKTTRSALVREAIERLIAEEAEGASVLDLVRDLVGIGSGPKDLSTNPKYMKGYGK